MQHESPPHQSSLVRGRLCVRARYVEPVKTCDFCGRQEADEARTLTWSTAVEHGRTKTFCDTCSREHLRAMEGKLDSDFW
jgi:ribosomal protein L37E